MNLNDTVEVIGLVVVYLGGIFLIGNFMARTIGKRIDELSNRISDLRSEMNNRFSEINNRIDDLRDEMNNRFDDLRSQTSREHDALAGRVESIDKN